MAQLIPNVSPAEIKAKPERDVAQALMDTLPQDCLVYHSYPWLYPERNDQKTYLREGEVDFIILSPFGILILEVKGGPVFYDPETSEWRRGKPNRHSGIKDPFRQASESMHKIVKRLEKEYLKEPLPCGFGYAVVFPDCRSTGTMPPGADPSIVFDSTSLSQLGPKLLDLIQRWSRHPNPTPLEGTNRQRVRTGLAGTFRLLPALGRQLADQEETLIQLTDMQTRALAGLLANPRLIVTGPAGSGKTMLAVATAKKLASQGKKVLLLCFNRLLADWLREILPADTYPTLTISTFNGLCAEWCERGHLPYEVPDSVQEKQEFFRVKSAELLLEAIDRVPERFDAIVADEAQDFEPEWWMTIELLNANVERGSLYIFHDPQQNMFVNKTLSFPSNLMSFELPVNCRNTRRIAEKCSRIRGVDIPSADFAPEGTAPQVEQIPDRDQRVRAIEAQLKEWLRDLKPSQIAVLTPYSLQGTRSSVGGRTQLAGVPVSNDPVKWRNGEGLLLTTIRSFKGLEADAVIVTDIDSLETSALSVVDLYVAFSRAKHFLTVYTTGVAGKEA